MRTPILRRIAPCCKFASIHWWCHRWLLLPMGATTKTVRNHKWHIKIEVNTGVTRQRRTLFSSAISVEKRWWALPNLPWTTRHIKWVTFSLDPSNNSKNYWYNNGITTGFGSPFPLPLPTKCLMRLTYCNKNHHLPNPKKNIICSSTYPNDYDKKWLVSMMPYHSFRIMIPFALLVLWPKVRRRSSR